MSEIEHSIENWNNRSFQEYKEWLFKEIKTNQETSVFLKNHIENFMSHYKKQIGVEGYFLLKKLFFIQLELKNFKDAHKILLALIKEFGKDKQLLRMYAEECEIDPKGGEVTMHNYKSLIINDQNDNETVKKYILFMKNTIDLNNRQTINDYIELWNQYLEVYMNDPFAFNELSQVYLMVNEYDKAAFCLEELLLYSPNDYKVLNKLGDIYTSKNNAEDAKTAIKFYSRSILIQPTPRAFFGIQNCASIIKKLDDKTKKLVNISKTELSKMYEDTPFKTFDVNKIFNV